MKYHPSFIFSFKLIVFSVVFSLIISWLSQHVPINLDDRLQSSVEYLKDTKASTKYDVFFFSNSYVFTAYDPLYLEHLTGMKSIHFGTDAQRLAYTVETIKSILKISTPKSVVIDLSQSTTFLSKSDTTKYYHSRAFIPIGFSWSKLISLLETTDLSTDKNYILNSISMGSATLNNLNRWKDYGRRKEKKQWYYGFLPLPKQRSNFKKMSNDVFLKRYYHSENKQSPFFDSYSYNKLYTFLKDITSSTDVKVVLVSSIKMNSSAEANFEKVAEGFKSISPNIYSINFNDLEIKRALSLDKASFTDRTHLQHKGALAVTNFIAPLLRDICYQTNNSTLLDKEHTLLFNKGLRINDSQLVLDDHFQKTWQFYLDSIPPIYHGYKIQASVYPKKKFEERLLPYNIKKGRHFDNSSLPLTDLISNGNKLIGTLPLHTNLKKEEIDRIEIWFWKQGGFKSNRIMIYKSD